LSPLEGKRILVIEDEALVAVMIEDMLAEAGATVIGPATSVTAGLALADLETIDAAVLDVNLRGERIDAVAELLRRRAVPIVFATGYGEGMPNAAPGDLVLDKPYTQESLTRALATALARR
jgi:CheY-like chemotaxis protein